MKHPREFAIVTGAAVLLCATNLHAVNLNDPAATAAGGIANYWDTGNTYPNVVSLFLPLANINSSNCTGTLINSRTILTAAHCLFPFDGPSVMGSSFFQIRFNPDAKVSSINDRAPSGALAHSAWDPKDPNDDDIALLSLKKPVAGVPPVILIRPGDPLPPVGTLVTMAGYGLAGTGMNPGTLNDHDSRRRVGQNNTVNKVEDIDVELPFIAAKFRDPAKFPPDTLPFLEALVSQGDSGGPLFIVTEKGLVQIGIACCGKPPAGYGDFAIWTAVISYYGWILENDPLRITASRAGTFSWSQSAAWIDTLGRSEVPNNSDGNFSGYGTLGRYYDVSIAAPTIMSLDMNPTIDTLSIVGAQSQLVIGAPFTLEVLLGTTLSAGTLTMGGGTLISPAFLISGGLLTGNGLITASGGDTGVCADGVCNTGGTVLPVGTLTIQGNYRQTAGTLAYQLSPSESSGKLEIKGAAKLGGTLAANISPGLYANSTNYAGVVTANTVEGHFDRVAWSPATFFNLAATYTPSSVDLTLNRIPFGAVPGLSANQRAVGNALESAYSTSLAGQQAAFYMNVLGSPTTNVLTQISGEAATGAQYGAFQLTSQFLGLMLDPFVDGRSGVAGMGRPALAFAPQQRVFPENIALAYASVVEAPPMKPAAFGQRWTAWGSGFGGSSRTSGDPAVIGSHDLSASVAGFAGGFDYRLTPDTVAGFAFAGAGTSWSLAQGLGSGKSDAFQAGAYGATRWGAAYLAAAFAYANHWMSTNRAVLGDHLTADFNAQSLGGRLEGGYRFGTIFGGFTPYAAIQAQSFRTPSYSETDVNGGGFGLAYSSRTGADTRSELGARFDHLVTLSPGAALSLRGRLAWAHDWVSDPTLAAAFQTLPDASFIVNGATPAKNSALASAGAELRLANGVTLLGKFDGEFASHSSTYAGTGTIRYTW